MSYVSKTFLKYLRLGVIPRIVRGNWVDGDYMYSFYHEDVQYTIDDMGDYEIDSDVSYIMNALNSRLIMIERNHSVIRDIYNHIKSVLGGDVWVRINNGHQLNCSFGNKNGIIAHFLMDFIDDKDHIAAIQKFKNLVKNIPEFDGFEPPECFIVMVLDKTKNNLFDNFSHPNVEVLHLGE